MERILKKKNVEGSFQCGLISTLYLCTLIWRSAALKLYQCWIAARQNSCNLISPLYTWFWELNFWSKIYPTHRISNSRCPPLLCHKKTTLIALTQHRLIHIARIGGGGAHAWIFLPSFHQVLVPKMSNFLLKHHKICMFFSRTKKWGRSSLSPKSNSL